MRTLHALCFVAVIAHAFVSLGADLRVPAAYSTIQAAVDAARAGDTILVAPGEYRVSAAITFRGKAITVRSEAGPAATSIRPVVGVETRLFTFAGGETELSLLQGFTLTGGNTGWPTGGSLRYYGGAMLCLGASPSIRDCIIVDNDANVGGGVAILASDTMPAAPTFSNCLIARNSVHTSESCIDNWDICRGDAAGGNVYGKECAVSFLSCTIADGALCNGSYCFPRSVYASAGAEFSFLNCIIWDDGPYTLDYSSKATVSIAYSCVKAAVVPAGDGNINEDPLLVDFRLPSSSPAVNAGIAASGVPLLDLDGNARPCWGAIDMGAFEYSGAEPPANYPLFVRGDANASGLIDIADAVFLLSHLFAQGAEPLCLDAADTNDSGEIDIADAVAVLSHLFAQAGPLPAPFGECGLDPTPDDLECGAYAPCE